MNNHELLKKWIDGQDVKNAWLAKRVHVKTATITRWTRNAATPNTTHALKIEEITGGAVPADGWAR